MNPVANAYAKALFETYHGTQNGKASESGFAKQKAQAEELAQLISSSPELKVVLYGPVTSSKEKVAILKALLRKSKFESGLQNFLLLMAQKGRLNLLPEIPSALDHVRLLAKDGVLGKVESADELSEKEVDAIAAGFQKKLGCPVELEQEVNESLMAGLRVTVNGVTYDGTLRAQLNRLSENFVHGAATIQ